MGETIYKKEITGHIYRLDLSEYSNGIYFIEVTSNSWSLSRKIVKVE